MDQQKIQNELKKQMKKQMKRSKGFMGEFKKFISKGNVMDLAVGVIIGGAFSAIVTSLVTNILTPLISLLTGKVSFNDLFFALDGKKYATLAAAKAAGAATLNYGLFIQSVIDFLIVAFVIFLIVRSLNKLHGLGRKKTPESPSTKKCPYCKTEIDVEATRCPNCTSELPAKTEVDV